MYDLVTICISRVYHNVWCTDNYSVKIPQMKEEAMTVTGRNIDNTLCARSYVC